MRVGCRVGIGARDGYGWRRLVHVRVAACCGLVCLALGCAGARQASATQKAVAAALQAPDAAEVDSLFDALPGEGRRCSFARTADLTDQQRATFAELLPAESFLWDPRLRVRAFATVTKMRGGLQARSAILLVDAERGVIEEVLAALPRYHVRLGGEPTPCSPDSCPLVVRFVAPHLVRLDLGQFNDRGLRSETVHDCVRLAKSSAEVRFAMSERTEPTLGSALGPLQLRVTVTSHQGSMGVTAREVYVDQEAAQDALKVGVVGSILRSPVADLVGTVSRRLEGRELITEQHLLASDLEQLHRDVEISQRAHRYGELLARVQAFDMGGSHEEREWLNAIDERLDLLEASGFPQPEHPLAKEIAKLLQAAQAAYPQSAELSQRAARFERVVH